MENQKVLQQNSRQVRHLLDFRNVNEYRVHLSRFVKKENLPQLSFRFCGLLAPSCGQSLEWRLLVVDHELQPLGSVRWKLWAKIWEKTGSINLKTDLKLLHKQMAHINKWYAGIPDVGPHHGLRDQESWKTKTEAEGKSETGNRLVPGLQCLFKLNQDSELCFGSKRSPNDST